MSPSAYHDANTAGVRRERPHVLAVGIASEPTECWGCGTTVLPGEELVDWSDGNRRCGSCGP